MISNGSPSNRIVELGKRIYQEQLRAQLEPARNGEFVAIDVESGDYELGKSSLAASGELRKRRPGAIPYLHRVGHQTTYKMRIHLVNGANCL